MKNRTILTLSLILFSSMLSRSQTVIGLWNVTQVSVGEENMTPVSKWFKFTEDGTATGGNGWTQNSSGTWRYDEKKNEFSATNELGIKDEFEPFKVKFEMDTMKWVRLEEGMKVEVKLTRIKERLPAPIDLAKGLWALTIVEDTNGNQLSNHDPKEKQYLWIRPDMRFQFRNRNESLSSGFWHMDGHRPILTLINDDRTINNQVYLVSFNELTMTMKSKLDRGNIYYYSRIYEFPK